jgi:hypothetical protein
LKRPKKENNNIEKGQERTFLKSFVVFFLRYFLGFCFYRKIYNF